MIISVLLGLVLVWGQMMTCTTAQGQGCIHGEIRTVEEGDNDFIQFCVNGEWRLHCTGANLWRSQEATVACRQLGYDGATRIGGPRANSSGAAHTDKFFRFAANCNGNENNVRECGGEVKELTDCHHTKLTGTGINGLAVCKPVNCAKVLRLINGSTGSEGRVEVCQDGRWRTVCNDKEGLAGAVCIKMGFSPYRATVHSFSPSTPPNVSCPTQTDGSIDPLQCTQTARSCDSSRSLGVVCKTHEEAAKILQNETLMCETESSKSINMLNTTLKECRANAIMIVEENITRINTALQQCLAASTDTPVLSSVLIPALGAVIGLLLVLLMIAAIGWIVTCVKLSRSSVPRSKITAGVHEKESYSLRQAVYDEATQDTYSSPSRNTNSSLGPNYDMVITNTDDLNTYDVIDHNQKAPPTVQAQPVNHTPVGASKKDDDFYDAEEHTYAMVDKKKLKKKEANDQPNYEKAAESLKKVPKE